MEKDVLLELGMSDRNEAVIFLKRLGMSSRHLVPSVVAYKTIDILNRLYES